MAKPRHPEILKPRPLTRAQSRFVRRRVRKETPGRTARSRTKAVRARIEAIEHDIARLRYIPKPVLLPMHGLASEKTRTLIREMYYPLPANASAECRSLVEQRLSAAKQFLYKQWKNPSLSQALFNSYYSGLLKTLVTELYWRRDVLQDAQFTFLESPMIGSRRRFPSYEPKQRQLAAILKGGTLTPKQHALYASPNETGRSELREHEFMHLAIGMEIFRRPESFDLEKAYKRVVGKVKRILREKQVYSPVEFYAEYQKTMD